LHDTRTVVAISAALLERNVVMLLPRVFELLVPELA
jgi:hypothetical protein